MPRATSSVHRRPLFLDAQLAGRKKPLFDQARPLYLAPLNDVDLGDYISDRFAMTGKDVGEALDPLLRLVRGHPQRAMLLAHHLWEQTPDKGSADIEVFDTALDALDREMKERFDYTWNQLGKQTSANRALKALALSKETFYNRRTLAEFELAKSQAASAQRFLKKNGEVWEVNGQPQIIDPLLERWIQQREQ